MYTQVNNGFGKNANSTWLVCIGITTSLLVKFCVATIGVCVFRCGNFGCRTFIFAKLTDTGGKMSNYSKNAKQSENRELFKRAIEEGLALKISEIEEELQREEPVPISREHKIKMNNLFREHVGGSFLPFPEENTN